MLLDLPFCVVFFLKEAGPPSAPRDVMMRSLNLGFGSGGMSAGALTMIPSTFGSCKSTLALRRQDKETVRAFSVAYRSYVGLNQQHLLWIHFFPDLLPAPIWVGGFCPSCLFLHWCRLYLLLLVGFSCRALDLLVLFFHLFSLLFRRIITHFGFSLLY